MKIFRRDLPTGDNYSSNSNLPPTILVLILVVTRIFELIKSRDLQEIS